MDIRKLSKLLELTNSNFDGECLNAIRKANALLLENNITWTQLLSQKQIVVQNVTVVQELKKEKDADIERMFGMCLRFVKSPSGVAFIKSLRDFYVERHYLTKKQRLSLKHWYDNL